MRMGLAAFLPLKYGLADAESPEVIDLLHRVENAMEEGQAISLHGLMADLEALPPSVQNSRAARSVQGWLLGERRQHARALAVMNRLNTEWSADVDGPTGPTAMRWLVMNRSYEGMLYLASGRPDQAAQSFADARHWLRQVMDRPDTPRILNVEPAEAERLEAMDRTGLAPLLLDTLRLFDTHQDSGRMARVANNLGHLYLDLGEPLGARYWFERSVELLQQRPADIQLVYALDSLGQCYRQLGMLAEARPILEEALMRATRLEAPCLEACILAGLADLERDGDQEAAALELYRRSQALEERLRNPTGLARTRLGLATLHRRAKRLAFSLAAADEAENLLRFEGAPLRDEAHMNAHVAALLLDRPGAAQALGHVVDQLKSRCARRAESLGRWYLALAAHRSGAREESLAQASEALALAERYRHLHLLALELPLTSELVQLAVEHGLCPEGIVGLMQRATPAGLTALLEQAPASAPILAALGRMPHAGTLSVRLLGLFRVTRAGREIDLQSAHSQKAVSLLKYLLSRRGQSATREQIVDTIWPEANPEGADRSLQVTLSTLRRLLDPEGGPPVIVRRAQGYMINPEIPLQVDVDHFMAHLKQGNWWLQRGQHDRAEAEWRLAETYYGGDLLADDPYAEWVIPERERLQEQYLDLLLGLAENALRDGRYPEVIDRANQILAADPIRESAYRLLMQAHASMGDRAVAIRDYRRCTAALKRELDEEPMEETRALAAQIWTDLRGRI